MVCFMKKKLTLQGDPEGPCCEPRSSDTPPPHPRCPLTPPCPPRLRPHTARDPLAPAASRTQSSHLHSPNENFLPRYSFVSLQVRNED